MDAHANKLLLAHEDIETLGFLFSALVNDGFEVGLATCGETVLQALEDHGFDVAVVSFSMQYGGETRVHEVLQSRFPQLPLVLLADDDVGEEGRAMAATKTFAYLVRPFDVYKISALSHVAVDRTVLARAQLPIAT
jgi:DNA-binding NtrC family response regulator